MPGTLAGLLLALATAAGPVAIAAQPPAGPSRIAQALLARCDALAADPDDPANQGAGVALAAINAAAAQDACAHALLVAPDNPRLSYQRGRALVAGGRPAEALTLYLAAAGAGYAPAEKAVGDAYMTGAGLPAGETPDPARARGWYDRAAARGYAPALAAVGALPAGGSATMPPPVVGTPPMAPAAPNPPGPATPTPAGPRPPANPAPSALIAECDRLASDPDDPGRIEAPVAERDMAIGRAIAACTEAVAAAPGNPRMHYQLGRALRLAARYDESFDAFVEAADLGYAPAEKAIGDAYRFGRGLRPGELQNADTARAWYRKSVARGTWPAGDDALAEMEKYILDNTFDPSRFRNPKFIEVLYTKDFSRLADDDLLPFLAYAMGMYEEMDSEQVIDHSPQCKPLQDVFGQQLIGIGGFVAGATQVVSMLAASPRGDSAVLELGLGFLVLMVRYNVEKDLGVRDTYNIVNHYGCANAIGERLVMNLGRIPLDMLAYYGTRTGSPTGGGATPPRAGTGAPVGPATAAPAPAPAGTPMRVEALDQVNVRSGPGSGFARVGRVRNGDRVLVQRQQDGWSHIGSGWVNSRLLVPE